MSKYAAVNIILLVDTSVFSHYHEVEKFLSQAAEGKGFQLENITAEGSPQKIIKMDKIPEIAPPAPSEKDVPLSAKAMFDKVRSTNPSPKVASFQQGKYLPRKDYLKKS